MNGFRITILVLLCLVVGLMAYVVFEVLPEREADYRMYNISQRNALYEKQDAAHQERVSRIGAEAENPEVAQARTDAAESDRRAEQALNEAEERAVIEEAKRREAAAVARQAQDEATALKALGRVASYNPEWNSIMIEPLSTEPINVGLVVAVRRGGRIVAEAQVDFIDESGQIGAVVKSGSFNKTQAPGVSSEAFKPAVGDEVIVTPFPTTSELRGNGGFLPPSAGVMPAAPAGELPIGPSSPYLTPAEPQGGLPEVDASFTPLP